jgi:hypothetical protein
MTDTRHSHDAQVLEARFALRLVGGLNAQVRSLPPDVSERLRFAREQALARAREVRAAAAVTPAGVSTSGVALLGSFLPWLQRAASVLPLLLLLVGLLLIQQWQTRESVLAAAEIDAQLLADALPPDAYSDPGFAEFLRAPPPP